MTERVVGVRIVSDDEWLPPHNSVAFLTDSLVVPADANGDPVIVFDIDDFFYWFGERPYIAPIIDLKESPPAWRKALDAVKKLARLN